MNTLRAIRLKRDLRRYAQLHRMPVPAGFRGGVPRLGEADRELLKRVQTDAGIEPTGALDGPTIEALSPDTPFNQRVVRIARAELTTSGNAQSYAWAGQQARSGPALSANPNWPYRGAGSSGVGSAAANGRSWPSQSQWGGSVRRQLAAGGFSDHESLPTAFCWFVVTRAGYSGPWPVSLWSVPNWIEFARSGASEHFASVAWNEARGGDLVAFHWGGEGPADHLGISLRYRRFFHDVATLTSSPPSAGSAADRLVVNIPLFTWQIEHVIRLVP